MQRERVDWRGHVSNLCSITTSYDARIHTVRLLDTAGTASAAHGLYWYLVTNYDNPGALEIIETYVVQAVREN